MEHSDVVYEIKRLKRKCKRLYNEWDDSKRLMQEKRIEYEYREILCFILDNADENQKRKRDDIIYIDNDEEDGCDGQKEDDKSFVVKTMHNGIRGQRMRTCAENAIGLCNQNLNDRATFVQHPCNMPSHSGNEAQLIKKNTEHSRIKSSGRVYQRVGRRSITEDKTHGQKKSKALVKIENEHSSRLIAPSSSKLVIDHSKHAYRGRCGHSNHVKNPRKKIKVVNGTKPKEEIEPDRINSIQIMSSKPVKENMCSPADQAQSSQKEKGKDVLDEYKRQEDRKLKGRNVVKGDCVITIESEDSNLRNHLLNEDNDEVEILDSAAFMNSEILSPFVPATRVHKSMLDEDIPNLGLPIASDEFRKEVLKVLRKPKDEEEYKRLCEAIRAGSYLDHYKCLGRKLSKYRHRKGKCCTILRGFFFWLENLTREGAFQPWNDRQCLAVEPS